MNEEKIKARLAQSLEVMEETPMVEPTTVTTTDEEDTVEHIELPYDRLMLRTTTMDMLNIPTTRRTDELKNMVDYVIRWASDNSPSNEMTDILETIALQGRIMGIQFKEDKLQRLYRYAKLSSQRKAIEIQMRELNG